MVYQTLHRTLKLDKHTHSKPRGWTNAKYFDIECHSWQQEVFEDTICQRGSQNPYVEEEQTTQSPKEKIQKNKQRSTKHTHKTKDRVTRTLLKTGGEKTY